VDEDAQRAKKRTKPAAAARNGDGTAPDGTPAPGPVTTSASGSS
jgi:hypothetical protein